MTLPIKPNKSFFFRTLDTVLYQNNPNETEEKSYRIGIRMLAGLGAFFYGLAALATSPITFLAYTLNTIGVDDYDAKKYHSEIVQKTLSIAANIFLNLVDVVENEPNKISWAI